MGRGAIYHISSDIMNLFEVNIFAKNDWADNYLMYMGRDAEVHIPMGLLRGWQNTYDSPRVVVELGLHYIFRKFQAKNHAMSPPKEFTMTDFVNYINYYSTNKSGYCDTKICNYILESQWQGAITKAENLVLYDEPEHPDNIMGCAVPPTFGIPTLEEIARRVILDDLPRARVEVYRDDIRISMDEIESSSQSVSHDEATTHTPTVPGATHKCTDCGGDMVIDEYVRVHVRQGPDGPQVTGCGIPVQDPVQNIPMAQMIDPDDIVLDVSE